MRLGDIELTNYLIAKGFGAVTNTLKEPHLFVLGLLKHQMNWLTSQVNNLAVLLRKKLSFNTQPNTDAISGHGQMLPVNCSAAGGSFSGNIQHGVIVNVSP